MKYRLIAVPAALAVAVATGLGAQSLPSIGGPLPGPFPLFPASNWWNLDISGAPVDTSSPTFISFVGGAARGLHADMGGSAGGHPVETYGIPYVRVGAAQPKLSVRFDYWNESDGSPDPVNHFSQPFYPIPSQAVTQPHWIEGGWAGNDPNARGDRHMLIVDVDNRHLYELFDLRWNGANWDAGSGAFWDMKLNGRRPETWTSADAAGLAILPGLIRYDEVFSGQPIGHAFRVTVHASPNYYVYPASHKACTSCPSTAPPMGARFRLKASKDISAFPAHIQRVLQAMKTHGLLVADNGSDMFITGTYDTRWDGPSPTSPGDTVLDEINGAFGQIKASDFEVVRLGYRAWDLSAGVTDSPDPVEVGSSITYTASVSNLDLYAAAPGVVLTDTLPGGVTFVSAPGCTQSSGTVTCSIGSLAPGATVNRTITVTATVAATLTNTVTVSHSDPSFGSQDSVPGNNTATTTTTAQQAMVSVGDVSVTEGNAGPNTATFTVTRSGSMTQTVTVSYSTADGTANAGSDYTAASGTVTFAPGEVSQPVLVTVSGDLSVEPNETFFVNLGTPTNATLTDGQGVGTIFNDDPPAPSAFAELLMLGQVHQTSVSNVTPTRWFKVRLVAGRSYSASAWAPATDASESPVSLDVAWFLDDGVTAAAGVNSVQREPTPQASDHSGDAKSIIPTNAQCAVPSGCTYRVRLQGTGATTVVDVRLMVLETTMVSPYWQVATAAGYDAAVQIRNNTSGSVPVTFTAYQHGQRGVLEHDHAAGERADDVRDQRGGARMRDRERLRIGADRVPRAAGIHHREHHHLQRAERALFRLAVQSPKHLDQPPPELRALNKELYPGVASPLHGGQSTYSRERTDHVLSTPFAFAPSHVRLSHVRLTHASDLRTLTGHSRKNNEG